MIEFHGIKTGGYEYLWSVSIDGVHFPGVTVPPETFSARGAGGQYLVVVPAGRLVIVHRFDNEPSDHSVETVFKPAYQGSGKAQFGPLLELRLDAAPH